MAGDWLKFDKATPDKPEVFAIAAALGIDPDSIVGKLMRVWSWFDTHTTDGNALSVTPALLDRCAGVTGFVLEMQKTGWMVIENGGCRLPNFERHCGETSKKRALGAKRSAGFRVRNASMVTEELPTRHLEKRREEKKEQKKRAGARAVGARLPMDWTLPDDWRAWANAERPDLDASGVAADFADFWHAKAGKDAAKLDWLATWRRWVRHQQTRPKLRAVPSSDDMPDFMRGAL